MNDIKYRLVTGQDRSDLKEISYAVTGKAWPEFMFHDPVSEHFNELYEKLRPYQFCLLEPNSDTVIALGNSIPLAWDGEPSDLPDTGWDWAMEKGIHDNRDGNKPSVLCAIQIVVAKPYLGKGVSAIGVETMKSIAREHNLKDMYAPVRPSMKTQYPLIPIENYIKWKNDDGLPFDAWMRVHARVGADIIKVCHQAMQISGTVSEWEEWTGMKFLESGNYTIPGALIPVDIDLEADRGTYIEPNVWMHHRL